MTEREGDLGSDGSRPPMRPKFEFRSPPSAVAAPRPQVLTVSWALWLVAAVAGLVAVVGPLLGLGDFQADLRAVVERDYPTETPVTRDRVVTLATTVLIGGGILLASLEAGFAAAMRSGHGGARIVLVLVFVPVVLHALLLLSVAPPVTAAGLVVGIALALVAAVLMFLPDAGAWFARRPRP